MKCRILIILLCISFVFLGGCVFAAKLGTKGRDEQLVKAEFNLSQHNTGRLLIIVRANTSDRDAQRLSYNIYRAVSSILLSKEIIAADQLIDYRQYLDYKKSVDNTNDLSLPEIGSALNADTVFELKIENYELVKLPGTNYYSGNMVLGGLIYDVQKRWPLWPEDGFNKQVSVGFDIESAGYEGSLKRLALSGAHCITRYLYDCRLNQFKIFDENTESQW